MPASRVPVEIARVQRDGNLQMVPQVPLGELMRYPDRDLQREMDSLVAKYSEVLTKAKEILASVEAHHREIGQVPASLYWDLGDLLQGFIESNERSSAFLNGIKGHFIRDLGISNASWKKILRLRHLVPARHLVDNSRSWKFYRDAPSEVIQKSLTDYRARIARSSGKGGTVATQPTLPPEKNRLSTAGLTKRPRSIGRTNLQAIRGRNRIEVHLPPEVIDRLSGLAEEFGLSGNRPSAAARALLIAILNQFPGQDPKGDNFLANAKLFAESHHGKGRKAKRA